LLRSHVQYFESIDHLFATLDAMPKADLGRVRAPAVATDGIASECRRLHGAGELGDACVRE
jgi:hypothetical protein